MGNLIDKLTSKEGRSRYIDRSSRIIGFAGSALEFLIAILVILAAVVTFISIIPDFANLFTASDTTEAFMLLLEKLLVVIIGIEFLEMLCKPSSANVLEAIIFLVARHMIINETTPLEDLTSTVSIVLLILMRTYLPRLLDAKLEKHAWKKAEKERALERDFDKDE